MRYIGNKLNLLEFIDSIVKQKNLPKTTFFDIFSGTANVAKFFKTKGYKIISNDFMTYSYILQRAYIQNNSEPSFEGLSQIIPGSTLPKVIAFLNKLEGEKDFIFKNYCIEGSKAFSNFQRNYFSSSNAQKIDAIRNKLDEWKNNNLITDNEFYILLASLLEDVPSISNISGTYGAFLKSNDPRFLKSLTLKVPHLIKSDINHISYKEDANKLIKQVSADILYIDPPYNARQYASNYHILESIAVWDKQILENKSGLRPYNEQKSLYCYSRSCTDAFKELILNAKVKFILFSYNTEGIIPYEEIMKILALKGHVEVFTRDYRRFKSNSKGNCNKENLKELLFFVEVF